MTPIRKLVGGFFDILSKYIRSRPFLRWDRYQRIADQLFIFYSEGGQIWPSEAVLLGPSLGQGEVNGNITRIWCTYVLLENPFFALKQLLTRPASCGKGRSFFSLTTRPAAWQLGKEELECTLQNVKALAMHFLFSSNANASACIDGAKLEVHAINAVLLTVWSLVVMAWPSRPQRVVRPRSSSISNLFGIIRVA